MRNVFTSDLRGAVRSLRRARGFTGVAILTLGLALTLCLTVLRIVNAYLIHTLPYPAADRLYSARYAPAGQQTPPRLEALDWRSLDDVIEHPIAWDLDMFYLLGDTAPDSAQGAWVTPGFVEGLGIRPAIGRGFRAADFEVGQPNVVLIGHRLWQNRFGGEPAIVGRRFRAYVSDRPDEAETFTIIGVLPPDFWHLNPYTDVLAPLRAPTYPYLVRLREGVPPNTAAARITALVRASLASPSSSALLPAGWRVVLTPTQANYVAQVRPLLHAAGAAAGLTLAVGCANIAVLLLVRASRREKEMAVRRALGASRGQLARLVAIEAMLLAGVATVIGLAASGALIAWLTPLLGGQLGRSAPGGASAFALDGTVLLGAVACGLFTACACALAPLAASWQTSVSLALARDGRGTTDSPGRRRARSTLIALEVAASLALLTGAALMTDSALRMLRVDFGMRTHGVLTASVALRQQSYPDAPSRAAYFDHLLARLARIPGTEGTAITDWWPLQPPPPRIVETDARSARAASVDERTATASPTRIAEASRRAPAGGVTGEAGTPGQPALREADSGATSVATSGVADVELGEARMSGAAAAAADAVRVATRAGVLGVSPDYFAMLGIPLRDGRAFSLRDRIGGEPVVMVSDTLTRRLWPKARAVGQRLRIVDEAAESAESGTGAGADGGESGQNIRPSSSYLVVGVVSDVRQTHADEDLADLYVPLLQRPGRFAFAYLRTPGRSGAAVGSAERNSFAGPAGLAGLAGPAGAAGAAGPAVRAAHAAREAQSATARVEGEHDRARNRNREREREGGGDGDHDRSRELRVACAEVDPEASIGRPRFLDSALDQERARPRFLASLLAVVSAFAAVIALVGLYGVIAYAARQREREIAVRMALGAGRATVTRQFLREGAIVLAIGLVAGLCAAPAIGRILESQLYGVRPLEPRILALTTIAFAACGLLAIWRPARRAATTDPALALRGEP